VSSLWRTVLLTAMCLLVATGTAQARSRPPLRNACQLATTRQVVAIMAQSVHAEPSGDKYFCGWVRRKSQRLQAANAGYRLTGYKRVADAKAYFKFKEGDLCEQEPEPFLPGSRLGNEATLVCGNNVIFRLGHVVGEVSTSSDDVEETSNQDVRRTAKLARRVVARLRRFSCPRSFCRI
jgi:hypothetical protein